MQSNGSGFEALERISYSKLSTFEQCPRKFFYKYEQKKRADVSSLALEIGTISHYGKELIGLALMRGERPDYEAIKQIVMDGYDDEEIHILGINELKEKYFFEWVEPDNKSGMTYDEKLEIYFSNLHSLEKDASWEIVACELEFDFLWQDLIRLYGFIDRVDRNVVTGEYRVVDYKSSKKMFDDKDTKTPLQMLFYTLAIEHVYGMQPVEHLYDFMFLGKIQECCSKGYYKRGTKKLLKLWDELCTARKSGMWIPKATPLCHWCDYCRTNPRSSNDYNEECKYYSLWTPNNKTYAKNKEFDTSTVETGMKPKAFWF
jgi:CRISPR/Cas system-associated exonuclease Cas4 (RecB family)